MTSPSQKEPALTKEQRNYIRERLSDIRREARKRRKEKRPAEVIAAERLLDRFQVQEERSENSFYKKVEADERKVLEALLFSPEKALAELKKFEAKYLGGSK